MKKTSFLALVSLALLACQSEKQTEEVQNESPVNDQETVLLTDEQKAEGWKLLFDGKTMDGWRTYKNRENTSWEVTEGTLHCKSFEEGISDKRSDLITADHYENFELAFEWRISPQGNSGVIFRTTEEYDEPYMTGPEYQILDDEGYPGDTKEVHMTAANYDMYTTESKTAKPVGEWNTSRIVANGSHIEHWLNNTKVLEYELGSEDWTNRKNGSKWKDVEGYGVPTKGHIDLQDHGNEVWFRNIMIREL